MSWLLLCMLKLDKNFNKTTKKYFQPVTDYLCDNNKKKQLSSFLARSDDDFCKQERMIDLD